MKKLTALITSIVLGASATAMARPVRLGDDHWRERQELRLDQERFTGVRHYRPTWTALSSATRLADGRDVVVVGEQQGRFTQLRFQTTQGSTLIDRVLIRFSDGRWQTADLGARIAPGNPMVELPLDGDRKQIDRIIVLGDARGRAAYQIFGI
jgi:hypothetical protein